MRWIVNEFRPELESEIYLVVCHTPPFLQFIVQSILNSLIEVNLLISSFALESSYISQ